MKVGFSLGRCIRDIVNGAVDINDVVVIVAGTMLKNKEELELCLKHYVDRNDYLLGLDYDLCWEVAIELWDSGRIHQPRKLGFYRSQVPENYVWADLYSSAHSNDMIDTAWKEYRTMISLIAENEDHNNDKQKKHWVQR